MNEYETDIVMDVLKTNDPNYVHTIDFANASYFYILTYTCRKAISSFKAVDIDDSHTLNVKELTTLLWLCNGEEPTEQRAKTEH